MASSEKGKRNLIPFNKRTVSEQRKIQVLGGKASGKARAAKRDLRQEMQAALDTIIKNGAGEEMTVRKAIALAQIKKALSGDSNAFKNCGEYADEKPAEKQEIAIKEPRKFVFEIKK